MSETSLSLSTDINVITAQIHFLEEDLDRTMNERAFQIGKLLNHVKEEIKYGGFTEWLENNFNFSRRYGYHFMTYYNQYKDVKSTSQLPNFSKEVEIMSLPPVQKEEIKNQVHTVPSTGETKNYDELTQKEVREVKKAKQLAEDRAERAEAQCALNVYQHSLQRKAWLDQIEELKEAKAAETAPDAAESKERKQAARDRRNEEKMRQLHLDSLNYLPGQPLEVYDEALLGYWLEHIYTDKQQAVDSRLNAITHARRVLDKVEKILQTFKGPRRVM